MFLKVLLKQCLKSNCQKVKTAIILVTLILVRAAVFFWVVQQTLYFQVLYVFDGIFQVQFYSPGTSVSTVLHYYHLTLNFRSMNRVMGGNFSGFHFMESIFGRFSFSRRVFFGVVQKYPTPLIPVCWYAKSTPLASVQNYTRWG